MRGVILLLAVVAALGLVRGQALDCAGIPGGDTIIDACGVCGGNSDCRDIHGIACPDTLKGCDMVCFSGVEYDACNVCGGLNATLDPLGVCCDHADRDCNAVCHGPVLPDDCGVCFGNNTNMDIFGTCCELDELDCHRVCYGEGVVDRCGDCGGRNARLDHAGNCCDESARDCARACPAPGVAPAVVDGCGVCGGNNVTMDRAGECCAGSERDCTGLCHGSAVTDACGVCGGVGETCCGAGGACSGRGVCSTTHRMCLCDAGWTGYECQIAQDICAGVECGAGVCEVVEGRPKCICPPDARGPACDVATCHYRGAVVDGACLCLPGYAAETECATCAAPPSGNEAAVCYESGAYFRRIVVDRYVADSLLADGFGFVGGKNVSVYAADGDELDCACRAYASVAKRYDDATGDEVFNTLLPEMVSKLTTTNEELIALGRSAKAARGIDVVLPSVGPLFLAFFVAAIVVPGLLFADSIFGKRRP